jgi:hypothetical protein
MVEIFQTILLTLKRPSLVPLKNSETFHSYVLFLDVIIFMPINLFKDSLRQCKAYCTFLWDGRYERMPKRWCTRYWNSIRRNILFGMSDSGRDSTVSRFKETIRQEIIRCYYGKWCVQNYACILKVLQQDPRSHH